MQEKQKLKLFLCLYCKTPLLHKAMLCTCRESYKVESIPAYSSITGELEKRREKNARIFKLITSECPPGKTRWPGNSPTFELRCKTNTCLSTVSTIAPFPRGLAVCLHLSTSSTKSHPSILYYLNQLLESGKYCKKL